MATDAYVGKPGAGKSHGVVQSVIIPALKSGRRVVHNMPLKEDGIRKLVVSGELVKIPPDLDAAGLVTWFRADHKGALLVYDEMWRLLPSGMKAAAIPEDVRSFFAEHRHMSGMTDDGRTTDIVLVTQDLSQVAQFLRALVEQTFLYFKRSDFGLRNRYRVSVYSGAVTGEKPPQTKFLNAYHGKYKPEIFDCYTSHTMSTGAAPGVEEKDDARGSMLKRPYLIIAAVCAALALPMFFLAKHAFFAVGKPKGEPASAERSESGAGQAPKVQPAPKPQGPKYSERWRYAGEITRKGRVVAIIDSPTGSRFLPAQACPLDAQGNPVCILDGELVTPFSGVPPRDVIGSFVTAAATPASQLSPDR